MKSNLRIKYFGVLLNILFVLSTAKAQELNLSATNFNGYHVSCYGAADGSIDLTITGGTPPYTIRWSTDATTEDLSDLPAGYYRVEVDDEDSLTESVSAEITLMEPRKIEAEIYIHKYNDKYNISVFGACNGMISFVPSGGVTPYTYLWSDNNTTDNRTNLCADRYIFVIEDDNGCRFRSEVIDLKEPDRNDWQMTGNVDTDSNMHFIGTNDQQDLIFKTNAIERIRIGAEGSTIIQSGLTINNALFMGDKILMDYQQAQDSLKEIFSFGSRPHNYPSSVNCNSPQLNTTYQFPGNLQLFGFTDPQLNDIGIVEVGFDGTNGLIESYGASTDPNKNRLLINYYCGNDVFVGNPGSSSSPAKGTLTANHNLFALGQVGIGTTDVQPGYKLVVDGGKVGFREAYVKLIGQWPDYVFSDNYKLMSLNSIEEFYNEHNSLPGMPTSSEIEKDGQNLGEIQRLHQEKIEELFLYIVELNKKLELLKEENRLLIQK